MFSVVYTMVSHRLKSYSCVMLCHLCEAYIVKTALSTLDGTLVFWPGAWPPTYTAISPEKRQTGWTKICTIVFKVYKPMPRLQPSFSQEITFVHFTRSETSPKIHELWKVTQNIWWNFHLNTFKCLHNPVYKQMDGAKRGLFQRTHTSPAEDQCRKCDRLANGWIARQTDNRKCIR